jgi:N-acetylneuraminic acid mutarotase
LPQSFQIYLNGDWTQAEQLPYPIVGYAFAQCPEDPDSFYVILGETWRYDVGNGWTQLANPPDGYWLASAVCYQGKIYLAGGEYLGGQDDFSIYDIANDSWESRPDLPRQYSAPATARWQAYLVAAH